MVDCMREPQIIRVILAQSLQRRLAKASASGAGESVYVVYQQQHDYVLAPAKQCGHRQTRHGLLDHSQQAMGVLTHGFGDHSGTLDDCVPQHLDPDATTA